MKLDAILQLHAILAFLLIMVTSWN